MRFLKIYFISCIVIILSLSSAIYALAQEAEQSGKSEVKQESKPAEETTEQQPIMEIKPLETEESLYSIELRDVEIDDLLRMLAQNYKLNIWMDKDVGGKVTASFSNIGLEEAIKTIAESSNLIFKKEGNVIKVVPNLISKTFVLRYIEAKKLVKGESKVEEAEGITAGATIFDLLSEKGKILLGEQPNSIMVIDYPQNIQNIEQYIKFADQGRTFQVFKLKYLSVSDLFPELAEQQRETRKKQREEREEERRDLGRVGVVGAGGGN